MTIKKSPVRAWAERYGVDPDLAFRLRSMMRRRHRYGTHECNGDPHVDVANREDKNANAAAWGRDVERIISEIDELCSRLNLTFDPGTGLWGSLMRDGHYIGDMPSGD